MAPNSSFDSLFELFLNDPPKEPPIVDIIVPIYNAYDFLVPMLNSLEQTKVPYTLFLINDCSTDERIAPYLDTYSKEHKNTTVLQNTEQLGYIKSVNQVLRMATHHVVLLNTDVLLPENWLERLLLPILSDPTVASATPFTNSGTICSFPLPF